MKIKIRYSYADGYPSRDVPRSQKTPEMNELGLPSNLPKSEHPTPKTRGDMSI